MKTYCFKCRKRTEIIDAKPVVLRNGQTMIRGVCSVCGLNVLKATASKSEDCVRNLHSPAVSTSIPRRD